MRRERGFALLAVLWLVTALAGLAAGGVAAARAGSAVTMNRVALARARWAAEGCLAVHLWRLDSVLLARQPLQAGAADTLYFANQSRCWSLAVDPGAEPEDDTARVNLNAAPAAVLAGLPGFTEEAVGVVLERRELGERLADLFQIIGRLTPVARAAMLERYGELLRRVEFAPSRLVVAATGAGGLSPVRAEVEVVVAPAGERAAVIRRRMR
jgi:type II secretory pathway component PulK